MLSALFTVDCRNWPLRLMVSEICSSLDEPLIHEQPQMISDRLPVCSAMP